MGNALTSNIYLDIPLLICGVQNSFLNAATNPEKVSLAPEMLKMLWDCKPNPRDLTSVVEQYVQAWWTQAGERKQHQLFDLDEAFDFHFDNVSWSPQQLVVNIEGHLSMD